MFTLDPNFSIPDIGSKFFPSWIPAQKIVSKLSVVHPRPGSATLLLTKVCVKKWRQPQKWEIWQGFSFCTLWHAFWQANLAIISVFLHPSLSTFLASWPKNLAWRRQHCCSPLEAGGGARAEQVGGAVLSVIIQQVGAAARRRGRSKAGLPIFRLLRGVPEQSKYISKRTKRIVPEDETSFLYRLPSHWSLVDFYPLLDAGEIRGNVWGGFRFDISPQEGSC